MSSPRLEQAIRRAIWFIDQQFAPMKGKHSMNLVREFVYRIVTTSPLPPTTGSPFGERIYAAIVEGEIEGPRLRASLAAPGSDWMGNSGDGYSRPDVHLAFRTHDGEALLVRCSGLIELTPAFMKANKENAATGWDDQYLRLVMRFDIGAERYRWLNTSLFIAKGRLFRTGSVECEVFRAT
jgi:Protein of unknown function (DUF3237)